MANRQMISFLQQALADGQNVILAGSQANCWNMAKELLQFEPATVVGNNLLGSLPLRWQHSVSLAGINSASHLIDFSADFATSTDYLLKSTGALVWVPAASVSQALMRFEIGCRQEVSPLLVPAIFNLVAVIGTQDILELDQLIVAEPAYKPVPISLTNKAPEIIAPTAAQESDDLFNSEQAYQEEASLAQAAAIAEAATMASSPDNYPPDDDYPDDYEPFDDDDNDSLAADDDQAFDPGWELDMLMANGAVKPQDYPTNDAEGSSMAATYRLAPPPKPLSMIDAERAAKPGSVVLPPPVVTPQTQAVLDSFERQYGTPATPAASTPRQGAAQPRSFQQVFAERQRRK